MATGASTPSSRRTSSPVQRCEASERTRQPNRRERSSSGRASVDVQNCRTSEFWKCVSLSSAADLSRSSKGSRTDCRRSAPRPSGYLRTPPVYGLRARAGQVGPPPWEFAQDRRKSAPMPAAPRASVERRHVDPDDQPVTRLALRQRLSAPLAPPPTKLRASGSGQRGRPR
jgi:hypothetical protein